LLALAAVCVITPSNFSRIQEIKGSAEYTRVVSNQEAIAQLVFHSDVEHSIRRFPSDVDLPRQLPPFTSDADISKPSPSLPSNADPSKRPPSEEVEKFIKEVNLDPNFLTMARKIIAIGRISERFDFSGIKLVDLDTSRLKLNRISSSDLPSSIDGRILAITAEKLLVDRFNELFLIGDYTGSIAPLIILVATLLAAYFALQVQSVFYTQQVIIVYRHPIYAVLFVQLALVMIAPLVLIAVVEGTYWSAFMDLAQNSFGKLGNVFPFRQDYISDRDVESLLRLRSTRVVLTLGEFLQKGDFPRNYQTPVEPRAWHLTFAAAMLSLASTMAVAIWLNRRFGWGAFLAGLIGCGIVFLLLTLVGTTNFFSTHLPDTRSLAGYYLQGGASDNVQTAFLISELIFIVGFVLAVFFLPYRLKKYFVCGSYSGVLFSLTFLTAFYLAVPLTVPVEATLLSMLITICVASIVEFLMQKSLYSFLYAPRP
jgi:hypothetical protein